MSRKQNTSRNRKHKAEKPTSMPELSLSQASSSWFVLASVAYCVKTCTVGQFRTLVKQCKPAEWHDRDAQALLRQRTLDDFDKWYVLCSLLHAKASMTLYASQAEAEQVVYKIA